jgi:choline kinase
MQAIILSAGQGSRLLPLTEATPKCLLPLGEETILSLQIRELAAAGIREITVVTGFRAAAVESELARLARPSLTLKTIFNPFYGVADNLGSCWLAREAMLRGDFLLVNGDTLFERAIPARLLQANGYPVTLTIDQKDEYDSDDMKVAVHGLRLVEVGKRLNSERVDGESIGMSRYQGEGGRLFTDALEHLMRAGIGVRSWYLKAIDLLAQRGVVGVLSIRGLRWGEVDFPHDLARARRLFAGWPERASARPEPMPAARERRHRVGTRLGALAPPLQEAVADEHE